MSVVLGGVEHELEDMDAQFDGKGLEVNWSGVGCHRARVSKDETRELGASTGRDRRGKGLHFEVTVLS